MGAFPHNGIYPSDNAVDVFKNLNIPEAKHAEVLADEPLGPTFVIFDLLGFCVSGAVDFNNQPRRKADEVSEVRPKRILTAKA